MKFSICVPNYNYGHYIDETIRSALAQPVDLEVIVADNASTDNSIEVIRAIDDPRVSLTCNRWNVGFAGNLDRATRKATGDRMILLSADDLIASDGLAVYDKLAGALGEAHRGAIFSSGQSVIDGAGEKLSQSSIDRRLWRDAAIDDRLSDIAGAPVWHAKGEPLLRQSLGLMRVPFNFLSTCYPRDLYEAVEGYGGGRLIGPDKDFGWKILSVATDAYYVDAPLFQYRVHNTNQAAQQSKSGAIKHMIDEYVASFDTAPSILARAGLSKDELAAAFVEQDVGLRGMKLVAEGNRRDARRGLHLGMAAYPDLVARSKTVAKLRLLLAMGPVGTSLAARYLESAKARWENDLAAK